MASVTVHGEATEGLIQAALRGALTQAQARWLVDENPEVHALALLAAGKRIAELQGLSEAQALCKPPTKAMLAEIRPGRGVGKRAATTMAGLSPLGSRLLILIGRVLLGRCLILRRGRRFALRIDASEQQALGRIIRQHPLATTAKGHPGQLRYLVLQGDHHRLQVLHVGGQRLRLG